MQDSNSYIMKSSTTILLVLALVIHHTWGVFDGRNPGTGPRPGDQFPITGTLLQCAGDEPGQPTLVGLSVTNPGDVFRPQTSPYRFPAALRDTTYSSVNIMAIVAILNQLNISRELQRVDTPPSFPTTAALPMFTFPERYIDPSMDRTEFQNLCGGNVLASTNVSDRNADQPIFDDITNMLRDDWLNIWDNLTAAQQSELIARNPGNPISRDGWITEQTLFFRLMLEVLSCRVAFRWEDAGGSYLPRYFIGGFCLHRNCSMPDRDEFRCHADLTDGGTRLLEAARWDCCWTYNAQDGYRYECGFRKVQFPIVCDCDCRCADKAGTK